VTSLTSACGATTWAAKAGTGYAGSGRPHRVSTAGLGRLRAFNARHSWLSAVSQNPSIFGPKIAVANILSFDWLWQKLNSVCIIPVTVTL
jgi:hypothetical protein